jgi:hypothetical protein
VVITAVVGATAIALLARRAHPSWAWLGSGVLALWVAFMALRTLH